MKFITYISHLNTLASARVLGVNENREAAGEGRETIEGLLRNPLSFSLADVNKLQTLVTAAGGTLTAKEKQHFGKLVNFHIARLQKQNSTVAQNTRTLFAVFRQPGLSQFLSSTQRRSIELFLGHQRRDLEKLSTKDVKEWSGSEAISLARSYRFVRNRLNTVNLSIEDEKVNAGDKLKQYAATLVAKNELTNKDKLFLVEMARVFPSSSDWNDASLRSLVLAQSTQAEADFKNLLVAENQNLPVDAQKYWDVLVPEGPQEARPGSPLNKFLTRSAQVESLQAIVEKDKEEGAETPNNKVPLLLTIEEFLFLKELTTTPVDSRLSVSDEVEAAVQKAKADQLAAQEKQNKQKALRTTEETRLKALPPLELKQQEWLTDGVKSEYKTEWDTLDENATPPAPEEGEEPTPQPDLEAYKKWKEKAVKDVLDNNPNLIEIKGSGAKDEEDPGAAELNAANLVLEQAVAEKRKLDESLEIYRDPAQTAQKMLDNHAKYFKARVSGGRMLSTDLDLIAHLGEDPESQQALLGNQYQQTLVLLDSTRGALNDLLVDKTGVNINNLGALSEQDLGSVDKFLSYEAVMQKLAATKTEGQTNSLLQAFETLENDAVLDARQVVESVVLKMRHDVLSSVDSVQTVNSEAYNKFLDQYTRQHHAINSNDRVSKLLTFAETIEAKKQNKVKDSYEHAYEKVSSLFATAEKPAIISGLNSILRGEESGEIVFEEIENALGNNIVHRLNLGQGAALKQQIVNALSGRVTGENQSATHLSVVADGLLAKLAEMQSGAVAKEALKNSSHKLEATDEDNLGITDRLELAKRTKLIHIEVESVDESFQSDLMLIRDALEKGENADIEIQTFLQNFNENYKPRLNTLKDALIAECDLYFESRIEFVSTLEESLSSSLRNLEMGVTQLRRNYSARDYDMDANDTGLKSLMQAISTEVTPKFNLNEGTLAKEEEYKVNSTLKEAAKTHKYVRDDLGLMKPGGAEKAKNAYEEKLTDYQTQVRNFEETWELAKKRLQKDLKKYTEEEFGAKHQMSRKQAYEIIKNNNNRVEDANWMMNYFAGKGESPYANNGNVFENWLADYERAETQPAALKFMKNFKDFEDLIGKEQENFAGEASEMGKFVKDYDANKPTLFFKKKYKLTVEWYSLKSIYMMTKQAWEAWGKKTERQNDRMAAALGSKIFGDTFIGREFGIDANKKEADRVSDFKESFGDKDSPYLYNRINKAKTIYDKDEARAAIELLMEKGELRWDNPEFLRLLGRLQGSYAFNPEEDIRRYVENPAEVKQKIGHAVTAIWDRPTWLQWKGDLPSKYKSQVESHANDYREEIQKGSVDVYLTTVLEQWERGEIDTNFERSKYESYLRNTFDNGEMNGYPNGGGGDRRWYYLIKGLTLKNPQGDTILSPDTLSRFGEMQGKMPFMDAFDDGASAKKNGKVVPDGTPDSHTDWTYDDFQCWAKYFDGIPPSKANSIETSKAVRTWLNETLLTTNDSQDRMAKIQLTDVDRDDAGILPLLVSSERLKDGLLRYSSGDKRPADDKYYVNLLTSFNNNYEDSLEYMKKIINEEDKEAEGYQLRKETQLRRFGEMMRTYFMISQSLAGNWDTEGSVGAVVLSNAEWNNNKGAENYQKINETVRDFMGDADLEITYGKRYEKQKSTNAGKYDTKDLEHKTLMLKVKDTYESKDFSDVAKIESYVQRSSVKNLLN